MKKVKQAEEKQNTEERQAQKNFFQDANFNQPSTIKFYPILLSVTKVPNYRIQLPTQASRIFHPPQLS